MEDEIDLRGIRAYGRHGANPGERDHPQAIDVDLRLRIDLSRARESDDLADTLDYAALHERIVAVVRDRSFALLEALADAIVRVVSEDARVRAVEVRVAKPRLLAGATPSVTVRTERRG